MYIRELRVSYERRARCERAKQPLKIEHVRDIAMMMLPLLEAEACEVGYVVCLNTKLKLIGCHEVSRGSLDSMPMHPREVFKAAVLANASGIVLVHNHPSGDPAPSADDMALTARMKEAGELIGIELLDHLILGHDGRFVSLQELAGLIGLG